MKAFVVADVHGFYDEMIEALNAAGFDSENKEHMLISCGDAIDRGPRPNEVIKYLINLPNKILIRGNHEDLMEDLILNPFGPGGHDISNGTYGSLVELASKYHKTRYGTKISKSLAQYMDWEELTKYARLEENYRKYKKLLVDYAEMGNYIFVHGWIPTYHKKDVENGRLYTRYRYMDNWREADILQWEAARWIDGCECTKQEVFEDGKTIICGHIHAAKWHTVFEGKDDYSDHSIYRDDNVIALDTCTVLSKKVNVLVLDL